MVGVLPAKVGVLSLATCNALATENGWRVILSFEVGQSGPLRPCSPLNVRTNHASMSIKATVKKAWGDPVWSKVISGGILAALGGIGTLLYQAGQWLMTISWGATLQPVIESIARILNIAVPLWVVLFLLAAIILARHSFKLIGRWARRGAISTNTTNTVSTQSIAVSPSTDQAPSNGNSGSDNSDEEPKVTELSQPEWTPLEPGVSTNRSGRYRIASAPTVFFADRMAFTFPGLNGLRIIDNSSNAIYRLKRLLHHPIRFDETTGHGCSIHPLWWTRGPSNLHIERFEETSNGIVLLGEQELKVRRIAAFNSNAYYQAFLYVEVDGMPPSGAYEHSSESMQYWMENHGYALEEYGYLNGRAFDLGFHDDGYLEIDGRVESVSGSERRRRYLTPYNFLIIPETSPLLDTERDDDVQRMLNDILHGQSTPEVLEAYISTLPKSNRDN